MPGWICSWWIPPTRKCPGSCPASGRSAPVLDRVFANATGRLIVASFASHVHRVQQVIDAAVAHNRKVALVGRSMVRNMNTAREFGYLTIPASTLVSIEAAEGLPDERVVLICTGSQGEPMAVLSRIANRDHKIEIGPGDTIVLASSLIPGNENDGEPRDQWTDPAGCDRRAQWQCHGSRLRPCGAGGVALRLQHREAAQRDAGSRRASAPARQRRAGDRDRESIRSG